MHLPRRADHQRVRRLCIFSCFSVSLATESITCGKPNGLACNTTQPWFDAEATIPSLCDAEKRDTDIEMLLQKKIVIHEVLADDEEKLLEATALGLLTASLITAVGVALFCASLGCIAFVYDRRAFKAELPADAAIFTVSFIHLLSVLSSSVMVPESYQLMITFEASALLSGMYVGIYNLSWGVVANIVAWLLMLKFPDLWRRSKWLLGTGVAVQLAGIVMYNAILFAADLHRAPSAQIRSMAVLSRALMGFGAGMVSYVWRFLIVHLFPAKDRPKANMAVPFVNMIGNGLGPLVVAIAHLCGSRLPWLPSTGHSFICAGAPQIFFSCTMCVVLAKFPSLEAVHDCEMNLSYSGAPAELTPEVSKGLDEEIPLWRKALLGGCVTFSMLWGLSFGGLEVAMIQILMVEFGLDISVACMLIACTILAVVPLKLMFHADHLHIRSWIHLLMCMAMLGAVLLFGLRGSPAPILQIGVLLVADTLIFPGFNFSWGLCDGIAVQHSARHGLFSSANVIMASQISFSTARLVGSMLSRFILTTGGRNAYAVEQILATFMAWTVAASLIVPYLNGKAIGGGFSRQNSTNSDAISVGWNKQHSTGSHWSRQSSPQFSESSLNEGSEGGARSNKCMADSINADMREHIPSLDEVIALCASTVEELHGHNARILSFWIGTGLQFDVYLDRGWDPGSLFGINYSEPLHHLNVERFPSIEFAYVWEGSRPYDPREDGPFDVVQMLWSLHFEHPQQPERRAEILQNVFDSLSSGGTLLLSEKTTQPLQVVKQYCDFQRKRGVSEKKIQAKQKSWVGVLETLPKEWYTKTLADVGFIDVSVIHEELHFVTWQARKRSM